MTDANRELGLLRSIAADLESYLKSDIVYQTLTDTGSFRDHYPQLSLGMLLLTRAKLDTLSNRLDPAAQTEMAQVQQAIAGTRSRWRANWVRKAEKESETRLNAWARAVQERSPGDYRSAAQSRLMLSLLLDDVAGEASPALARQRARLGTLDSLIRSRLRSNAFALDEDLKATFPRDPYWFLYGAPEAV
jgi:hypothetical protein